MLHGRSQERPSVTARDQDASLRIGVVDYLNAWPLWATLENKPGIELIRGVPSHLVELLRSGQVDCALISSVEYFNMGPGFYRHDSLCISAEAQAYSIRLFVPQLAENFTGQLKNIRRIYTDVSSRSSVAQLRVILHGLGADIPLEEVTDAEEKIPLLQEGEALIAIGDTALRHMKRASYDLQSVYYDMFGHGFVYALWVYREELKSQLEPILSRAYAAYQADGKALRERAAERFGFSTALTEEYLTQIIRYDFTQGRKADLEFYVLQKTISHP
jgi:chorismate dehydratase